MEKHYVLLASSSLAYELYLSLCEIGIDCTLAPTPRSADHCCGVCILYKNAEDKSLIEECSEKNDIRIDKFYDTENVDDPKRLKFC